MTTSSANTKPPTITSDYTEIQNHKCCCHTQTVAFSTQSGTHRVRTQRSPLCQTQVRHQGQQLLVERGLDGISR